MATNHTIGETLQTGSAVGLAALAAAKEQAILTCANAVRNTTSQAVMNAAEKVRNAYLGRGDPGVLINF